MPFLPLLVRAAPTGLPAGVPTDGSIPPAILSRIQAEAAAAASSVGTSIMTAAGGSMTSATGIALPTGTNGPPSGFSIPAGMTGPPAGFATMTGPPGRLPTGFLTGGGGGPPHRITDHRTRAMIGTAAMWLVLTTSVVLGRFISRRMVKQKIGADDYCSLVSLGILIGLLSEQFAIARLNQNLKTPYAPMSFGRLHLISTILYVCIITTARVSVLLLYRRVFTLRIKWFRIAWWISLAICVAYWITWFIMSFTSCTPHPLKSLWTAPWLCHESIGSISAGGFLNVAIDSLLLALPIRMIWLLQMSKKQKFAVSGVFALGLIAVAISLARAISVLNASIFTTGLASFTSWSTAEPSVILICACLPVMRPLWLSITKLVPSYSSIRMLLSSTPKRDSVSSFGSNEKTLTDNPSPYLSADITEKGKHISISAYSASNSASDDNEASGAVSPESDPTAIPTEPQRDIPTPASALLPPFTTRFSIPKFPDLWPSTLERPSLFSRPSQQSQQSSSSSSSYPSNSPSSPKPLFNPRTSNPWDTQPPNPYNKVETHITAQELSSPRDSPSPFASLTRPPPTALSTQKSGWKRSLSARYLSDLWARGSSEDEVKVWGVRKEKEQKLKANDLSYTYDEGEDGKIRPRIEVVRKNSSAMGRGPYTGVFPPAPTPAPRPRDSGAAAAAAEEMGEDGPSSSRENQEPDREPRSPVRRSGNKAASMLGRESLVVSREQSRARREREGSGERGVRDRCERYGGEVRGSWD